MKHEQMKHLRVTAATQSEFFLIQRRIALEENRRVSQEEVMRLLITNYKKIHAESKRAVKRKSEVA